MAWKPLAPRTRPHPSYAPYVAFTPTQLVFSSAFLKSVEEIFYLRGTGCDIYVDIFVDGSRHKIGFKFSLERTESNLKLHFQKRGWTGYASIYRLLRDYPFMKDIVINLDVEKRKFKAKKLDDLWTIDLSEYWR